MKRVEELKTKLNNEYLLNSQFLKNCPHCAKISELRQLIEKKNSALDEIFLAMKQYEMDVESDPPYKHIEMMIKSKQALEARESA